MIGNDVFNDGVIVQEDKGFHDGTKAMQVLQALEVFRDRDQRYQFADILVPDNKLGKRIATVLGHTSSSCDMLDFGEVAELGRGEHDRVVGFKIVGQGIICATKFDISNGVKAAREGKARTCCRQIE